MTEYKLGMRKRRIGQDDRKARAFLDILEPIFVERVDPTEDPSAPIQDALNHIELSEPGLSTRQSAP